MDHFDSERMRDEAEIKNLSHRYALALDRSDFDEWRQLFTQDSVWQTAGRPAFTGLDEIMDVPRRLHSTFRNTFHAVLTQVIQFGASETTGVVYCAAHHLFDYDFVSPGRDPVGMSYQFLMRYEDVYSKDDRRWKFAARKLIMVTRQIEQIVQFSPGGTWSAVT
ncbi:SnoaL-like domain-containing protein [Bradyrhizobium sp. Gha]|nr:SnoaL-like domain-containing protein [Bradyrhizobium sp. Gha]